AARNSCEHQEVQPREKYIVPLNSIRLRGICQRFNQVPALQNLTIARVTTVGTADPIALRRTLTHRFTVNDETAPDYSFSEQLQSAGGTCAFRKSAARLYASIWFSTRANPWPSFS